MKRAKRSHDVPDTETKGEGKEEKKTVLVGELYTPTNILIGEPIPGVPNWLAFYEPKGAVLKKKKPKVIKCCRHYGHNPILYEYGIWGII